MNWKTIWWWTKVIVVTAIIVIELFATGCTKRMWPDDPCGAKRGIINHPPAYLLIFFLFVSLFSKAQQYDTSLYHKYCIIKIEPSMVEAFRFTVFGELRKDTAYIYRHGVNGNKVGDCWLIPVDALPNPKRFYEGNKRKKT